MLLKPVRNFCALRNCMNVLLPKIGIAHHTIRSILFVSIMFTHTLPYGFQRFFTYVSKGKRSVGTGHYFSVRSNMHPASARKAPEKVRTHEIGERVTLGPSGLLFIVFWNFSSLDTSFFPITSSSWSSQRPTAMIS